MLVTRSTERVQTSAKAAHCLSSTEKYFKEFVVKTIAECRFLLFDLLKPILIKLICIYCTCAVYPVFQKINTHLLTLYTYSN